MAQEGPSDFRFKRRERELYLAFARAAAPSIASGLSEHVRVLDVEDAWWYLGIVSRLIRAAPSGAWERLADEPERLQALPERAQIRLMRRALSNERFLGLATDPIRSYYTHLREGAAMASLLGATAESDSLAFLARRLLQLVTYLFLEQAGLRLEYGTVDPEDETIGRRCIRPPGLTKRPRLRLIKGRS